MNKTSIFIRQKPVNLLLFLQERKKAYVAEIAKNADISISRAHGVMRLLEEYGLVSLDGNNGNMKKNVFVLTPQGEAIAKDLRAVNELCTPY